MAIAIRSGAPVTGSSTTATVSVTCTGTTQPQANDVLLIFHGNDFYALSAMPTPTVGGSTTGVTAITNGTADGGSIDAHVKAYTYVVGSTGDLTVSVTETGTADEEKALAVYVLSGVDTTTPVDAAAANTSTTTSSTSHDAPSVSPTSADAYLVCHVNTGGGSLGGTYTPPTGMTETYDFGVAAAMEVGGAVVQLAASGATGTKTFTITGSAPYSAVSVAVKTASAAASIPPPPVRLPQGRDPGEVWWIQRDRRDANTVATAANPLVAPLDTAWQADGRYWHLYNDLAYRPTLAPYAQRDRRDANTLGSSAADPLTLAAGVGGDTWRRYNTPAFADRREVPAQRTYVSGPGLLATALLENELLGSVDDLARHHQAAIYTDRRLVPQQRPYLSVPGLLDTAQLENELLGSFDDVARHRQAAAYVDRREVPQQRLYISDPLLLGTALLENGLLGSADDLRRHAVLSAYLDRRLVPQQRLYLSVPGLLDTAELENELLGGGDSGRRYHTAAEATDRRQVPQQRVYWSVPGLLDTAQLENELLGAGDTPRRYLTPATHTDRRETPAPRPTAAAIDDVTLVGTGAVGAWWGHDDTAAFLYGNLHPAVDPSLLFPPDNTDPTLTGAGTRTAGIYSDRRQVPTQRPYVSPPPLLDTAQLENELLGSLDDLRRRYLTPAYTDRREVPQQRLYLSDPALLDTALLEGVLLGGADTARRYLTPGSHSPRWWMPQQPARQMWYYDAGPGSPPLTLTWGDGGTYWALYNQAGWQPDRRLVPQQRPYRSDPSFYPTVPPTDPLTVAWGAGGPLWWLYNTAAATVDRRLVPQQRPYRSVPGILDTALLENELLGGADDRTRRQAGGWWDRREVPAQRVYFDPTLLATALLEGALLGGGDTSRHLHAGIYTDRRLVPQQRSYWSVPGMLDTALLEDALLGGADDRARRQAGQWWDRREVPAQRIYFDPALLAAAQLENELLGGGDSWRHLHAGVYTDRREVPQQRLYTSVPGQLDTALLEGPLLGGDGGRHGTVYPTRWVLPWRQLPLDPAMLIPPVPADPLLLAGGIGGDRWRRDLAAAYAYRPAPPPRTPPMYGPPPAATMRDLYLTLGLPASAWTIVLANPVWVCNPTPGRWHTSPPQ